MNENLFISSNQEIRNKSIQINAKFKFYNKKGMPKNFEHFFYYNRKNKKLYYTQIKLMKNIEFNNNSEDDSTSIPKLKVEFKNGSFLIEFKSELLEVPLNILKDVYAKCNYKMIGDKRFSIFHTKKANDFPYSLPIIDTELFMVKDEFREMLLYDNYIIPESSEKRKTFAKIVREDNEFSLTLTNENMLKVDYQYLLGEQYQELYRPYFYELILNKNSQAKIKKELEQQSYNEEFLYEIEIVNLRDAKNNTDEGLLEGELLFSASPIKRIQTKIKILHSNKDKIVENQWKETNRILKNEISTIKNKFQIEKAFMDKISLNNFPNVDYEVKIFNVGQGNWIHISIYDGVNLLAKIIFDIGIGNNKGKHSDANLRAKITKAAAEEINGNDMFVLSHWDLDHIQGVVELTPKQFLTTWIVPDLPNNPRNGAKRLAAFLVKDTSINENFVDHSLNGSILFENDYFRLGKGKGNGPGKNTSYTLENNSGLILVIKKSGKKMLFPGDCDYSEFPSRFVSSEKYEALVVSHHGAEIKQTQLKFIECKTNIFAAVCVGEDQCYPKPSHVKSILDLKYQLHKTRDFKDVNKPCQYKLT